MTWNEFQTTVAGFANRTNLTGTPNMILSCANMAKAYAQRKHNFKMARGRAFLSPSIDGVDVSTATATPGGSAVTVKKLESAWLYTISGSNYRKSTRVPFMTLGDGKNFYDVQSSDWAPPASQVATPSEQRVFMQGTKVFLLSSESSQAMMFDAILLLADYTGSNTDFFLTYHSDWLVAKTLDLLNIYLKDDQRVMISQARLDDAWTSVISFDEDFAEGQFDIDSGD